MQGQIELQNEPMYVPSMPYWDWLRHLADAIEEINTDRSDGGLSCFLCITINHPNSEPERSAAEAFARRIGYVDEGGMAGTAEDTQYIERLLKAISAGEELCGTFGNFLREHYQRWGLKPYQTNELRIRWLREHADQEEAYELYGVVYHD